MNAVSLTFDPAQAAKIDALMAQFSLSPNSQGALMRGCIKALNRSAVSARVVMVREIAKDVGARQTDIKKYVVTVNATPGKLESRIRPLMTLGIPLGKLRPSGAVPSRGKGPGVYVPGQGTFPNAFIATVRGASGSQGPHTGVFERYATSSGRRSRGAWGPNLPIRELRTAKSLITMFNEHRTAVVARAMASLATNLLSELKHALATGA
jgi:hypothetical protein